MLIVLFYNILRDDMTKLLANQTLRDKTDMIHSRKNFDIIISTYFLNILNEIGTIYKQHG